MDVLLPEWAGACLSQSGREPEVRERISSTVLSGFGKADRFPGDVTGTLTTPTACNPRLATAVRALAEGRRLYRQDELAASEPLFRQAMAHARDVAPAVALEARFAASTAAYFTGSREGARRALADVAAQARTAGYLELLGRTLWMQGYAYSDDADFEQAVTAYRDAVEAFTAAGSVDGVASARSLMAGAFDSLGQYERGWREREQALARLRHMVDSRARGTVLSSTIKATARDGLHHASLQLVLAKLDEESYTISATRRTQALVELAEAQLALSRRAQSRNTLDQARALLPKVGSPAARQRLEARVLWVSASADDNPRRAATGLGQALALYRGSGADIAVAQLLLARARALVKAGEVKQAEDDLSRGAVVVNNVRAQLKRADFRLSYSEDVWDIFDELIHLNVVRGDYARVLEISEQVRGRGFRDARQDGDAHDRPPIVVTAAPIAYYVADRDQLMIWLVTPKDSRVVAQAVSRESISRQVREFANCAARAARIDDCRSKDLYRVLIDPVAQAAHDVGTLTIVADPVSRPYRSPRCAIPLPAEH